MTQKLIKNATPTRATSLIPKAKIKIGSSAVAGIDLKNSIKISNVLSSNLFDPNRKPRVTPKNTAGKNAEIVLASVATVSNANS